MTFQMHHCCLLKLETLTTMEVMMWWKKGIAIIIFICFNTVSSQPFHESIELKQKNMGGPRLGLTFIHGDGELVKTLKRNKMDRLLSQFGWHFEYQVSPENILGPSFVVQFVPLFGGVEYGKIIPSLTTAFGIRFPNGIEFGMGPNLAVSKDSYDETVITSALVLAIGKSIDYGGVSLPLNIVYAINPKGNRASFIFGYAL